MSGCTALLSLRQRLSKSRHKHLVECLLQHPVSPLQSRRPDPSTSPAKNQTTHQSLVSPINTNKSPPAKQGTPSYDGFGARDPFGGLFADFQLPPTHGTADLADLYTDFSAHPSPARSTFDVPQIPIPSLSLKSLQREDPSVPLQIHQFLMNAPPPVDTQVTTSSVKKAIPPPSRDSNSSRVTTRSTANSDRAEFVQGSSKDIAPSATVSNAPRPIETAMVAVDTNNVIHPKGKPNVNFCC